MTFDARCLNQQTIEGISERLQVDTVCFVIDDQKTPSLVVATMSPAVPMLHGIVPRQSLQFR